MFANEVFDNASGGGGFLDNVTAGPGARIIDEYLTTTVGFISFLHFLTALLRSLPTPQFHSLSPWLMSSGVLTSKHLEVVMKVEKQNLSTRHAGSPQSVTAGALVARVSLHHPRMRTCRSCLWTQSSCTSIINAHTHTHTHTAQAYIFTCAPLVHSGLSYSTTTLLLQIEHEPSSLNKNS